MFKEIIEENLNRIENDLLEIEGLQSIDFIDIFPTSEEHKKQLDNEPIKTKYGELKHIKNRRIFENKR